MLLALAQWLAQDVRFFNVFNYITLRAVLAAMTALLISLAAGPAVIRWLAAKKIGQAVRTDGPQTHLVKSGTPTMGGVLILIAIGLDGIGPWLAALGRTEAARHLLAQLGIGGASDFHRQIDSPQGQLAAQLGPVQAGAAYLHLWGMLLQVGANRRQQQRLHLLRHVQAEATPVVQRVECRHPRHAALQTGQGIENPRRQLLG